MNKDSSLISPEKTIAIYLALCYYAVWEKYVQAKSEELGERGRRSV
ncbi:MAG: hypothetical protein AB7W37_07995 [Syntrophobacteraceae bacterium]